MYIHLNTHIYTFIYIYIYVCIPITNNTLNTAEPTIIDIYKHIKNKISINIHIHL
jgi:hypothetical protein